MTNQRSLVFYKIIIKAFPILIWIPKWRKNYDFCVFQYLNHNNGLLISPFWCLCPFFSYFWSRFSGGNQSETGLLAICKQGLGLFVGRHRGEHLENMIHDVWCTSHRGEQHTRHNFWSLLTSSACIPNYQVPKIQFYNRLK